MMKISAQTGLKLRTCIISLMWLPVIMTYSCRNEQVSTVETNQSLSVGIIKAANGFSIERKDGYSVVTIKKPWQGADNISMSYYLLGKGSGIPAGVDSSQVIFVPIKKIICMSTTHSGMIQSLGEENSIVALFEDASRRRK